jgi:hypothetical protein
MYEIMILSAIATIGSELAAAAPIVKDSVLVLVGLAPLVLPVLLDARREMDLEAEARRRFTNRRRR